MKDLEVRNLSCSECGGVLNKKEGENIAKCVFCGTRFFVEENSVNTYLVPSKINRQDAVSMVRNYIKEKLLLQAKKERLKIEKSFFRKVRPSKSRLLLIPYYCYRGVKVGTAPTKRDDDVIVRNEFGDADKGEPILSTTIELRYKTETKVAIRDIVTVIPALNPGEDKFFRWKLDTLLKERDFMAGQTIELTPFSQTELDENSEVLYPFRKGTEVLKMFKKMYGTNLKKEKSEMDNLEKKKNEKEFFSKTISSRLFSNQYGITRVNTMDYDEINYRTDVIDDSLSLYFFPLWVLVLSDGRREYEACVDAARGSVISIEVPIKGTVRPWKLLSFSVASGVILSSIYKLLSRLTLSYVGNRLSQLLFFILLIAFGYQFFRITRNIDNTPISSIKVFSNEDYKIKV